MFRYDNNRYRAVAEYFKELGHLESILLSTYTKKDTTLVLITTNFVTRLKRILSWGYIHFNYPIKYFLPRFTTTK